MLCIFKEPHNDTVQIFNITKKLNKITTISGIFNSHNSVVDTMLIRLHPQPIFKNFFPNNKLSIIFLYNAFLTSKKEIFKSSPSPRVCPYGKRNKF